MNGNFKWPIFLLVILNLLYRLAMNDSIASNYETPPGYLAPKSIAQIEEEERIAFEKAMAASSFVAKESPPPRRKISRISGYKVKRKPVRKLH